MIWRVAAEDGTGQEVGSTIAAVAVHPRLRHDHEEVSKCVDRAADEWRARVTAAHRAFVDRRLAREQRTIARPTSPLLFQPGLFDRRTQRAQLAVAAARGAVDRERADRLAAIERARPLSFLSPQLLFVLNT